MKIRNTLCPAAAEDNLRQCAADENRGENCVAGALHVPQCRVDFENPALIEYLAQLYARIKKGGAAKAPAPGNDGASSSVSSLNQLRIIKNRIKAGEYKDRTPGLFLTGLDKFSLAKDEAGGLKKFVFENLGYFKTPVIGMSMEAGNTGETGTGAAPDNSESDAAVKPLVIGGSFSRGAAPGKAVSAGAKAPLSGQAGPPPGEFGVTPEDSRQSVIYAREAGSKLSLKDYAGALKDAASAIARNPANINAYLVRASAENYLQNYDAAIADATRVLSFEPGNTGAYNIRSWALLQKGLYSQAGADISNVIRLAPAASAYYNRSVIAEKTGNYNQMIEDLSEASRLDKSYSFKLGEALAKYRPQAPAAKQKNETAAELPGEPVQRKHGMRGLRWARVYIILAALLVGVFIIFHIVKIVRSRRSEGQLLMSQYTILRQIGEGGMGLVYEGFDKTLKRKVAIKRMRTDIGMSESAKEELLNEARTVASLHHPNIVEIYTVFEEKGDLFLVFQYVDGQTLETTLELDGKLALKEAKPIFESICKALHYAHSHNVIHRDLKPSNIMIADSGVVKVMDFGVAKNLDGSGAARIISGTPAYMAPEQRKGFIRKESDIYSLGICLYETLTGYVPWEIEGYDPAGNRIIMPSQVISSLPHEVDELIEMALHEDLEKRIATANQFWHILNAIKA